MNHSMVERNQEADEGEEFVCLLCEEELEEEKYVVWDRNRAFCSWDCHDAYFDP